VAQFVHNALYNNKNNNKYVIIFGLWGTIDVWWKSRYETIHEYVGKQNEPL